MATWVNWEHLEDWAGVDGIYLTYTADVSRSGNTITVSNQHVTWSKRGLSAAYGYAYSLYLDRNDNGSWTRQQTVWSGSMRFDYYDYPDYDWYPSDFTFTADTSSTSRQFRFLNSDGDGVIYFDFTFPQGYTAPDTPTVNITSDVDSLAITWGTASFGNPSSGTVYLFGSPSNPPTTQLASKTTTGNTTYNYTSLDSNTMYYFISYADNGQKVSATVKKNRATKALAPTVSVDSVSGDSITIAYTTATDGNAYAKTLEYSLDGGTTWVTGATVSTGTATGGTYTITGLSPGQIYVINTRVRTTIGTTTGATLSTTTGPNTPSVTAQSDSPTSIQIAYLEDAFNSSTGRKLDLYGGTTTTPSTLLETQTSPIESEIYAYHHTGLLSNKRYYYRAVATATFSGVDVSASSADYEVYTFAPKPTINYVNWQEFSTPSTQLFSVSVAVPADEGGLTKTVQYRTTVNGTTTPWTTLDTVSSGSATTVTGSFTITNNTSSTYTGTFETRTVTTAGTAGTNSTTFTVKAKANAPQVSSWDLIDSNATTVAVTGDNTIFIESYSIPQIRVAQSAITLADGASITQIRGTFDGTAKDLTLTSGVYQALYSTPDDGTKTGTLYIEDSLDSEYENSITCTVLPYQEPTIFGSSNYTTEDGHIDISIAGEYASLMVSGVEKNNLTVSYKVSSQTVLVDWTTVTATLDDGEFTAYIADVATNYRETYLVEVKVVDALGNEAEYSYVVSTYRPEHALDTPQYSIEVWTRDGNFLADISKYLTTDLNITWKLNDVEDLNFSMSLDALELLRHSGSSVVQLLTPYAHDVKIRRNGDYIVGCQVVEANIKIDNEQIPTVQIKATGYLNIFKDQYLSIPFAGYSYPVMAHRLIYYAQHADTLLRNPTGDIDASYWLSSNGTIAQTSVAKDGAGAIQGYSTGAQVMGSQMRVSANTPVHYDFWVSVSTAGAIAIQERDLITNSSTAHVIATESISTTNTYTHITGDFTTSWDNGYFCVRNGTNGVTMRLDDVYVSRTDDENALNNHYVGTIYGGGGSNSATSGYVSDREFNYELQNVKDAVMDLVNMGEDNFDFEFSPDRKFKTYERKGSDRTDIEILYPGNVHSMTIERSAADMANKVQEIGSGIGDERLEVIASDTASRQIYGTRESVVTANNVSLEDTLEGLAQGELEKRSPINPLLTVTIQDGSINCGNIETGDVLAFRIGNYLGVLGQQQTPQIPVPLELLGNVEGWYRVKQINARISQDGVEALSLQLEFEGSFEES